MKKKNVKSDKASLSSHQFALRMSQPTEKKPISTFQRMQSAALKGSISDFLKNGKL